MIMSSTSVSTPHALRAGAIALAAVAGVMVASPAFSAPGEPVPAVTDGSTDLAARRDPSLCPRTYQPIDRRALRTSSGKLVGVASLRWQGTEVTGYCLQVRLKPRYRSGSTPVFKQLSVRQAEQSSAVAVLQCAARQRPLSLPGPRATRAKALVEVSLRSRTVRVRLRSPQ